MQCPVVIRIKYYVSGVRRPILLLVLNKIQVLVTGLYNKEHSSVKNTTGNIKVNPLYVNHGKFSCLIVNRNVTYP